jgi:hypothetical protein
MFLRNELGIDSRAERNNKKRPDIMCYHNGLLIGIELSYSKDDAERDAEKRLLEQLADIEIAVWIKENFRNIPEDELDLKIRTSKFDIKILSEVPESLIPFLEARFRKRYSSGGWFTDVSLYDFKDFIENSIEYVTKEEKVKKISEEIYNSVIEFVNIVSSYDSKDTLTRIYCDLLWKLYGLSFNGDLKKVKEIIFGQVALSIILSCAFYEHFRNQNPLFPSLSNRLQNDPINDTISAFHDLLDINYRVALENTLKILDHMPPNLGNQVRKLILLGIKIVNKRILLKRDFAGRIYHKITGDLALRKGMATYYTEIPAAYLLSNLAINEYFMNHNDSKNISKLFSDMRIADFSCGSGTLLTSIFYNIERKMVRVNITNNLDLDTDKIGKTLLENGIYGIDALRYAAQITAINLALMSSEILHKQNIRTVYLGYTNSGDQIFSWLGSLELIYNVGQKFLGLLRWIEGGVDTSYKISISGTDVGFDMPNEYDIIIMNPPFSRATGRGQNFDDTDNRSSFLGFISNEEGRKVVKLAYDKIRERCRQDILKIAQAEKKLPISIRKIIKNQDSDLRQYLQIGPAGEGLLFLFLAFRYIKHEGVIAFVLPKNILVGISWFLARVLLISKFHVKYIISSTENNENNFSENSNLGELLIVAKRSDTHNEYEETVFLTMRKKP